MEQINPLAIQFLNIRCMVLGGYSTIVQKDNGDLYIRMSIKMREDIISSVAVFKTSYFNSPMGNMYAVDQLTAELIKLGENWLVSGRDVNKLIPRKS